MSRLGWDLGRFDQVVPFQASVRVPVVSMPTAMQERALGHDTLESKSDVGPAGSGLGTTIQIEPFPATARVCVLFDIRDEPTATQALPPGHDTPESELPAPAGFGLGTIDHALPFHCSTKV